MGGPSALLGTPSGTSVRLQAFPLVPDTGSSFWEALERFFVCFRFSFRWEAAAFLVTVCVWPDA